ncbi:MAG: hypothetical protein A07HB70_01993 [uncultured archaeon A07HB70]|nr:MAG: hypothetical protein A07HB70_01993 [uncultured archaeon A07HB70]
MATSAFVPPLRIVLGVLAGVVATLAMGVAMARLPEGETPPAVAAAVLTERRVGEGPARLAAVVHHAAGWLTGGLFVTLLLFAEAALGRSSVAYLATTALLLVLMVGFFAGVVLPRVALARQRLRTVVRDWTVSATVYLTALVALVWAGSAALAAA